MGYVHDTLMSQFIGSELFNLSAGTWAMAESSNVISRDRTAAAAAFVALIPVLLPSNAGELKGARLKSVDVWYSIGSSGATGFATVALHKMILAADTVAPSGAAVATALDTGHDTDAKRRAVGAAHCMTVALTTPVWVDDGDAFYLRLGVDCAAGTVFKFFGARANYDLRL